MDQVYDIKYAFDNLRDENDRPFEIKKSKLKSMPIFSKDDIRALSKSNAVEKAPDEFLLQQDGAVIEPLDEDEPREDNDGESSANGEYSKQGGTGPGLQERNLNSNEDDWAPKSKLESQ